MCVRRWRARPLRVSSPTSMLEKSWLLAKVCVCVCVYVCTHIYTHTLIHTYTHIYTHIHTYTHIYMCVCVCVCVCVCARARACACKCACVTRRGQPGKHTRAHARTHTHKYAGGMRASCWRAVPPAVSRYPQKKVKIQGVCAVKTQINVYHLKTKEHGLEL